MNGADFRLVEQAVHQLTRIADSLKALEGQAQLLNDSLADQHDVLVTLMEQTR